jgi:hypothetical protein
MKSFYITTKSEELANLIEGIVEREFDDFQPSSESKNKVDEVYKFEK